MAGDGSVKGKTREMIVKRLRAIKRYIEAHLPYGVTEDGYQRWYEGKKGERIMRQAWFDTSPFA